MAHDVFISYATEDKITADAVCATLEREGIRCWMAPRDLLPGTDWPAEILIAIEAARICVLVFSDHANKSRPVRNEIERAMNNGSPIIPFRIQDVPPAKSLEFFISTPHWLDAMTPPLEKHLNSLAGTVHALLERMEPHRERKKIVPPVPPKPVLDWRHAAIGGVLLVLMMLCVVLWKRKPAETISSASPTPSPVPSLAPSPAPSPGAAPTPQQSIQPEIKSLMERGQYAQAIAKLDAAIAAVPNDPDLFLMRGMVKLGWLDHKGAVTDLDEVMKLRKDDRIARGLRALGRISLEDLDGGLADAAELLKDNPNEPIALTARAMVSAMRWDRPNALKDAKRSVELAGNNALTWLGLGMVHHLAGDPGEALKAFNQAAALEPKSPGVLTGRAAAYTTCGNYPEVLADITEARRLAPASRIPPGVEAGMYLVKKDSPQALRAADEAFALDKEYWGSFVLRGSARLVNGDIRGATEDANRAITLAPHRADGYTLRSFCRLTDRTGSIADSDKARDLEPRSPAAWTGHALTRQLLGDLPGATDDFEMVLKMVPQLPHAHLLYAELCVAARRYADAERECKWLIEKKAFESQTHSLLITIYTVTGKPLDAQKARDAWNSAQMFNR